MSVTDEPIQDDIRRLKAMRAETRIWSIGSIVAIVVILGAGMGMVADSANKLFKPGPTQDAFAADLGSQLNGNVTPNLQAIAGQALTESQPEVQAQFVKLGTRVPEVSNAFMEQFNQLQKDLPERGDAVLSATFGQMLKNQEPKIKAMYPGVTDQAVDTLVTNVTNEAQSQFAAANSTLFAKHEQALTGITQDLTTIQNTEPINPDQDKANLDMAISVVEAFQSQLTTMNDAQPQAASKGVKKS